MNIYSREAVQLPSQLEGKQVRTVHNIVGPLYLQAMKAIPVEVAVADLAAGGQIDKIYGGLGVLPSYVKLQPNYKYLTLTRSTHNCGLVIANKAWFDSTTPHEQDLLRGAYPGLTMLKEQVADDDIKALLAELASAGSVITPLTPTQHNAWAAAALPLYPAILQQAGGRSIEVYTRVRAAKQAFLRDPVSNTRH